MCILHILWKNLMSDKINNKTKDSVIQWWLRKSCQEQIILGTESVSSIKPLKKNFVTFLINKTKQSKLLFRE